MIGITRHNVDVYLKPVDNYDIIGKIPKGDTVKINDVVGEYFTIQYKNADAYVDRVSIKFDHEELKKLKQNRKDIPYQAKEVNLDYLPHKKSIQTTPVDIKSINDPYKYEVDHIRYCAGRFNREMMSGYALSAIGTIITTTGAFADDPELPMIIGGGIGLIGTILIIDSNKWMKRINIGPNGVGIKYNF